MRSKKACRRSPTKPCAGASKPWAGPFSGGGGPVAETRFHGRKEPENESTPSPARPYSPPTYSGWRGPFVTNPGILGGFGILFPGPRGAGRDPAPERGLGGAFHRRRRRPGDDLRVF